MREGGGNVQSGDAGLSGDGRRLRGPGLGRRTCPRLFEPHALVVGRSQISQCALEAGASLGLTGQGRAPLLCAPVLRQTRLTGPSPKSDASRFPPLRPNRT